MRLRNYFKIPDNFPVWMLVAALLVTVAVMSWFTYSAFETYRTIQNIKDTELWIATLRGEIVHLDEVLTMSARMAAFTGDPQWEERYRQFEPVLDGAIKETIILYPKLDSSLHPDVEDDDINNTAIANKKIVAMEYRSFELVRNGKKEEAVAILFGPEYEAQKQIYSSGIQHMTGELYENMKNTLETFRDWAFFSIFITFGAVVVLIGIWLVVIHNFNRRYRILDEKNRKISFQAKQLQEVNRDLDSKVEKRTGELTLLNEKLLEELTRRQKLDRELQSTNEMLSKSNSALADFVTIASHDLQEPLRKIMTFSEMLKESANGTLNEDSKIYLDKICSSTERMKTLIYDLLTYSRVSSKPAPFEKLDLNKVIKDISVNLEVQIQELNAAIEVSELPVINANPTQMQQLFQNIIGNSLKYHRKGVAPIIKIYSAPPSEETLSKFKLNPSTEYHQITVEDNGIGFDEKYAEQVFEVFQRLHGRGEYKGTGIGLAVCKKVVERHSGIITATSKVGEGSKFIVILPATKTDLKEGDDQNDEILTYTSC